MSDMMPSLLTETTGLLQSLSPGLALALSEALNADIGLELENVEAAPIQEILSRAEDTLWTVFSLSAPHSADCVLLMPETTGLALAALLAGGMIGGAQEELTADDVAKLSKVAEGLVRGLASSLANLSSDVTEVETCTTAQGALSLPPVFALEQSAIEAFLNISLPDGLTVPIAILFTPEFAQAASAPTEQGEGDADSQVLGEDELAAMLSELEGLSGPAPTTAAGPSGGGGSAPPFANFPSGPPDLAMNRGLDLLLDIPLDVTVELGRVRMLIKDVLDLSSGSIIELDRVAGEPVDLLVNGRLVARGEVVVIEDNFGIRLTEIVSPADRVAGLGKGR